MPGFTMTITYELTAEFKARNEEEAQELADSISGELAINVEIPKGAILTTKARNIAKELEVDQTDCQIQEN